MSVHDIKVAFTFRTIIQNMVVFISSGIMTIIKSSKNTGYRKI